MVFLNSISNEALLAIAILVAGWFFTLLYDNYKDRKRLKERCNYFIKSIENVFPAILKQSEKYEEVSKDISDINNTRYKLRIATGLNFHFFQPNIVEDLHSFLSKKQKEAHIIIKDVTSAVNGINLQLENFKYNFKQYRELQTLNYENWYDEVSAMLEEYDKLFEEDESKGKLTESITNIRGIISSFLEKNDESVELKTNELVIHIKTLCNNIEDIRLINIKRHAQGVINFFENMKDNISHYTELFRKDAVQAKEFHEKLNTRVNEIKSLL